MHHGNADVIVITSGFIVPLNPALTDDNGTGLFSQVHNNNLLLKGRSTGNNRYYSYKNDLPI